MGCLGLLKIKVNNLHKWVELIENLIYAISIAIFTIFIYNRVVPLSIGNVVPSGDDPACHAIYIKRLAYNPFFLLTNPFQYPNWVHAFFAMIYRLFDIEFKLPKLLGLFSFLSFIIGIPLYCLLIYELTDDKTIAASSLILFSLFSGRITQNLNAGVIMELFDLLVLFPLFFLLILREHYFIAGFIFGLSLASWLGFTYISILVILYSIDLLIRKRFRAFLALLLGLLFGGNIFLMKPLIQLIAIFFNLPFKKYIGMVRRVWVPQHKIIAYMFCGNAWIVFLPLTFAIFLCIINILGKRLSTQHFRKNEFILSIFYFSLLSLGANPSVPLHFRYLRVASFISVLPITVGINRLSHFVQILIRPPSSKPRITFIRIFSIGIILIVLFALFSFSTLPLMVFAPPDRGIVYQPLVRADREILDSYAYFKQNYLVKEENCKIVVIAKISSWAEYFLYMPERNISVEPIYHEDILNKYTADPKDIELRSLLLESIINKDLSKLKRIGVKYLLIETPFQNQWYPPKQKELAYKLYKMDFSDVGTLIYQYNASNGKSLKIWLLGERANLQLAQKDCVHYGNMLGEQQLDKFVSVIKNQEKPGVLGPGSCGDLRRMLFGVINLAFRHGIKPHRDDLNKVLRDKLEFAAMR